MIYLSLTTFIRGNFIGHNNSQMANRMTAYVDWKVNID